MCVCICTHNLKHIVIQEGWFIYFNNRSNNTGGQLLSWGCKITKGKKKNDSRLLLLLKASLNSQLALCYHNSTRETSSWPSTICTSLKSTESGGVRKPHRTHPVGTSSLLQGWQQQLPQTFIKMKGLWVHCCHTRSVTNTTAKQWQFYVVTIKFYRHINVLYPHTCGCNIGETE